MPGQAEGTPMLKNYCIIATTEWCICATHPLCGGIVIAKWTCPEHGASAPIPDVMDTHFHEVAGFIVGTPFEFAFTRAS